MDVRIRTFIVGLIALLTALVDESGLTAGGFATYAEPEAEPLVERVVADAESGTITVRARYKEDGNVFQRNATLYVSDISGRVYRGRSSRFSQDVTILPYGGEDDGVADFDGNVVAMHSLDEVLEAIHRANGVL